MEVCYMSNNTCYSRNCGCGSCGGCGTWNDCWQGCGCSGGCGSCSPCSANVCGCGQCSGCNACSGCGSWGSCNACSNCNACGSWPLTPPPAPGSMIVPRVIASGRALQRCVEASFCAEDLPDCAVAPYTLLGVAACHATGWDFVTGNDQSCVTVLVTLRLQLQLRDANCCLYTAHSTITVEVPLCSSFPRYEHRRTHVFIQPNVRLTCAPVCSDTECFDVTLDVVVDVYLVRWEPSADGITVPCRPDLPLNLPASGSCGCGCRNRCWS